MIGASLTVVGVRSTVRVRSLLAVALAIASCVTGCKRDAPEETAEFVRAMNVGKAHLENRESKQAVEAYHRATGLAPRSTPALRNLARAHLLARQPDDARAALERAKEIDQASSATEYLLGLTYARQSKFVEAVAPFENAVRLDPHTAALRFQLANAYQATDQQDKSVEQLWATLRADPLHASAHFKLSAHARRTGDRDAVQRHTTEYVRLRRLLGDKTRTAEALEVCVHTRPEPAVAPTASHRPPDPLVGLRFADETRLMMPEGLTVVAAAVLNVDERADIALVVVRSDGRVGMLARMAGNAYGFVDAGVALGADVRVRGCVVGDFRNDVPAGTKYDAKVHARNDVVCFGGGGLAVLEQTRDGAFDNVTATAGFQADSVTDAVWVDYEHDGDLDLLVAGEDGIALWQNNGDGTFTDVTEEVGLAADGRATDVLAVDLDANVAVDLVVARSDAPTLVFMNQRTGTFALREDPPGPWPSAERVLADDINNDGRVDVVLIGTGGEALTIDGATGTRSTIELTNMTTRSAVLLDYDNDGWLDLLAVGSKRGDDARGAVSLRRNGSDGWRDVSEEAQLSELRLPRLRGAVPFDADNDGDTDVLLIADDGQLVWLRNNGGHVNGQLKIRLETIKTNPTGLGTHIELRSGSFWLARDIQRLPVELGLGGVTHLDSIQTVWANGVVDNKIDVPPGREPLTIVEKSVAAGSCPFLYAWDGARYRFVTDLLGNAPIGLSLTRGRVLPADPDEIVFVAPAADFPPRDGAYTLVITDEFREVLYLDQAKLIAVDHRPDVEAHPTDKLMPPPFPQSEVWALERPRVLLSAVGSDGIDRTDAVRTIDGMFAPPGPALPPPYRGMCEPLSVTMDFGPLDGERPWVLALTGWLQYGDASTNIALSQDRTVTIIPPTLEVEDSEGRWHPVDVVVGMPAGKTKTILCDLTGKLPPESGRVRMTTTFEIRWDRVALFERTELAAGHVHELEPDGAVLGWHGFSEIRSRAVGHPTTPAFEVATDTPPWRTSLEGWCTRYGDVLPLVREWDNRLVVVNAGDALTLTFAEADLPPVPDGLVRSFFLYSVGWDKDGDHNVVGGDVVEPLPRVDGVGEALGDPTGADDDESDWRLEYNTRFVPLDVFAPNRPQ